MRVTLSASIAGPARVHCRDPIRHADDVHGYVGSEAKHLGIRRPPLGHILALSHPKELAERPPGHAAREGMSSG
jgi:hypothetical protein